MENSRGKATGNFQTRLFLPLCLMGLWTPQKNMLLNQMVERGSYKSEPWKECQIWVLLSAWLSWFPVSPPVGFPSWNYRGRASLSRESRMSLTSWSEWTCAEDLTRVYPNSRAAVGTRWPSHFDSRSTAKDKAHFYEEFWNSLLASLPPSAALPTRFSLRLWLSCSLLLILLFSFSLFFFLTFFIEI